MACRQQVARYARAHQPQTDETNLHLHILSRSACDMLERNAKKREPRNFRRAAMTVHKNLIDGEWVGSDQAKDNISPSDLSDIVGSYSQASEADAEAAI